MLMTISDEQRIIENANHLLASSGIDSFPLRIKPVISYLQKENDLQIVKYSTLAKGMGVPVGAIGSMVGSDEAALVYNGPEEPAFIYYKDTDIPKERIRWNLGHEVAHFCCGHHLIRYRLKQEGLEMSKTAEARIEAEANLFIRTMHAPLELVFAFMEFYNLFDRVGVYTIVRVIFRLSVPASYYYTAQIFNRDTRPLVKQERTIFYEEFFNRFTSLYEPQTFLLLVYRYQREFDMFKTDLDRRASVNYRTPYQEAAAAIAERLSRSRLNHSV